jgi:hypothetical protein
VIFHFQVQYVCHLIGELNHTTIKLSQIAGQFTGIHRGFPGCRQLEGMYES